MDNIEYTRAHTVDEAVRLRAGEPGSAFIAGGTNLIDLMKGGMTRPRHLIDISRLPLRDITELPDGGVRLGAGATNAAVANHPLVRERYPLLARALLSGASPQLRNMATVGGNVLQRTRCYYFYDPEGYAECNKRTPGSGCAALHGPNRIHAILGASEDCIATNPSDMNVALAALRAKLRVLSPRGERTIAFDDVHRLPGTTPHLDTHLADDELITAVDLPASPFARHSTYLKVRDRASYAFALVSVAVGLDLHEGVVRDAALALGGVAHKPWRVVAAEQALVGQPVSAASVEAALGPLLAGARGFGDNDFKIELARRAVSRALQQAAQA